MKHAFFRTALVIPALFTAFGLNQMPARGDGISTLYSTGEALPTGVVDPNYSIVSAPAGATLNRGGATDTIAPVTSPAYAAAPGGAHWIGPNVDNMLQQPTGNYDFQTTFSLAGLDPSTATITGAVAADNGIADIKLNGVSLGISGGSLSSLLNYTITKDFMPGKNTLDFIVNNASSGGPTALMVSETGSATAAPKPSTFAVFGLVALVLFGHRASVLSAVRVS
jgi:hypothetical protein